MDNFGLQPPPPPTPPIPPLNSIPQVPKEDPQINKPINQMSKTVKKNGIKIVGGILMVVLIIGGAVLGSGLLKEKQRPVEKEAKTTCEYCVDQCDDFFGDVQCGDICKKSCGGDDDTTDECPGEGDPADAIDRCGGACCKPGQLCTNTGCKDPDEEENDSGCGGGVPKPSNCQDIYIGGGCNADNNGCKASGTVNKYACDSANDTTKDGCSEFVESYNVKEECVTLNNTCGVQQIDVSENVFASRYCTNSCDDTSSDDHESSPSPSPSVSPSPSPSPSPNMACVNLTSNVAINEIRLGSEVLFTCEASFSGLSPRAFFRTSSDGGVTYSGNIPLVGVPVNLTGFMANRASYTIAINTYGDWVVQCRICDNSATTCTAWGLAN